MELAGTSGIALLRTLVLARLLIPDDFGLVAIGLVTVEVSISLTNFGMREALVQKAELDERHYDTAWTFEIVRALAVASMIMIGAPLIAEHLFGEPRAVALIRSLALTPVLDHAASIRLVDLIRNLRFRALAIVNVSGTLVHTGLAIAFVSQLGVWALVLGLLVGTSVQTLASYGVAPHRVRLLFDRDAVRPLFGFGRWIFIMQIIQVLGATMLQAIVAQRLGTSDLGLYFLATRIARLPKDMVQRVVGKVTFSVYAKLQFDAVRAGRVFRATLSGMWMILMPTYAVAITLAPELVQQFVGPSWAGSVPVIRILAVVGLVGVLADATVPMLQGRGRPEWIVAIFGTRSVLVVILAWELTARFGLPGAALAWLAGEVAGALVCLLLIERLLSDPFKRMPSRAIAILATAAIGAGAASVSNSLMSDAAGVIGAVILGCGTAVAGLWWLDRVLRLGLVNELEQAFPQLVGFVRTRQERRP